VFHSLLVLPMMKMMIREVGDDDDGLSVIIESDP
jgi:hypothetical protein